MIKRFFLSRRVVLSLLLLLLGAIVCAYWVPQEFGTPRPELVNWRTAHPLLGPLVERLGLDHVYTSPWFALLFFLFLFSLTLSTWDQIRGAAKAFGPGTGLDAGDRPVQASLQECTDEILSAGYVRTCEDERQIRFVKNRWGYWGSALFHAGLVVTLASSLLVALTLERGRLLLIENEVYDAEAHWAQQNRGLFAGKFILPGSLRLDSITPDYWETDEIKQLTTRFSLLDAQGKRIDHTLSVNRPASHGGIKFYQGKRFGHAFFLAFYDRQGRRFKESLMLGIPASRNKASYGDFQLDWMPYGLKAKYFADAAQRTMDSDQPQLVLRIVENAQVRGEASLVRGGRGQLGEYQAELVGVARWGEIVFVQLSGMPGVFFGFAVIVLGCCLIYFMPPREFLVRKEPTGLSLAWKATRFKEFYQHEQKRVLETLGGTKST